MACNQLMLAADASGVRHSLSKSYGSEASRFVGCAELCKHWGVGLLGLAGPPQLSIPALNPDGTALEKTQIDSDSADVGRT